MPIHSIWLHFNVSVRELNIFRLYTFNLCIHFLVCLLFFMLANNFGPRHIIRSSGVCVPTTCGIFARRCLGSYWNSKVEMTAKRVKRHGRDSRGFGWWSRTWLQCWQPCQLPFPFPFGFPSSSLPFGLGALVPVVSPFSAVASRSGVCSESAQIYTIYMQNNIFGGLNAKVWGALRRQPYFGSHFAPILVWNWVGLFVLSGLLFCSLTFDQLLIKHNTPKLNALCL